MIRQVDPIPSAGLRSGTPERMPRMQSSDGAAAADPPAVVAATPLAALLSGQILRDGEVVILLLRPSRWFILLTSLRFLAICAIFMILAVLFDEKIGRTSRHYLNAGAFLIAGRLTWATLQWMGRLYILTDLRILRISGVFHIDIFHCALRKVARTFLDSAFKEKLCRVGTITIIPQDEEEPIGYWQMVAQPRRIYHQVLSAIRRAKQGSVNGAG
jgi:hypothetical protein